MTNEVGYGREEGGGGGGDESGVHGLLMGPWGACSCFVMSCADSGKHYFWREISTNHS